MNSQYLQDRFRLFAATGCCEEYTYKGETGTTPSFDNADAASLQQVVVKFSCAMSTTTGFDES